MIHTVRSVAKNSRFFEPPDNKRGCCTTSRLALSIMSSTLPPPAPPAAIQLVAVPSPPPPPQIDYVGISETTLAERDGGPPLLLVELIATASVVAAIAICCFTLRWYRARELKRFLAGLPEAAPDGTWLVVAYDWEASGTQSGRMPLDGITSMTELVAAAVEYGSEVSYMHPRAKPRPARMPHTLLIPNAHVRCAPSL